MFLGQENRSLECHSKEKFRPRKTFIDLKKSVKAEGHICNVVTYRRKICCDLRYMSPTFKIVNDALNIFF